MISPRKVANGDVMHLIYYNFSKTFYLLIISKIAIIKHNMF
jgi:hypothetical protein